jgi:hypothetical protein
MVAVRDETVAHRRPVVYVHGDSDYFGVGKPLLDAQGRRLENFTRLETFGDNQANGNNDVHWVKMLVDPSSRDVFGFQPQIVPPNRTAVEAPWRNWRSRPAGAPTSAPIRRRPPHADRES